MANTTQHFIRIPNPRGTRRVILENARDVLTILKGYEDFKKIRSERLNLVNKFKNDMNEIRSLIGEFKNVLPKAGIREVKRPMMATSVSSQKPMREARRLEQELAAIESKLNQL